MGVLIIIIIFVCVAKQCRISASDVKQDDGQQTSKLGRLRPLTRTRIGARREQVKRNQLRSVLKQTIEDGHSDAGM